MIQTIPLNKLVASSRNVRRSANAEADLELKADIEAHGLLQNLVVTSLRKPKGCFAVEAGERRRRALQALADEGKLAQDHDVSCLVVDPVGCEEASLAENFQRLAMNPADECLAFKRLADQGSEPEAIARRFGLTVRFVEGRLRLANLAPVVFEALGAGEISLDVAKAYGSTADTERQAYVFEQVGRSYMSNHPDSIRRMMTQATASGSDRRARLVGEEAYVAAGGRIERDLFADADEARWLDVALLERLACEKMGALAAAAAKDHGLAFVRPTLEPWAGYPATDGLRRIHVERAPLGEDEAARVEAIDAELETLSAQLEDEEIDEEGCAAIEARIVALEADAQAIRGRAPFLDDELRLVAGKFLLLEHDGSVRLGSDFYVEASPEPAEGATDGAPDAPDSSMPQRVPGLARRLVDELAIQRRDVLAAHVAADPAFALDLAAFLMADGHGGYRFERSGSTLSAPRPCDPVSDFQTPEAPAAIAEAEARAALDRSWQEAETRAERFDAFRGLPTEARAAWLAHSVARTLEASAGIAGERACAFHDHLGGLLGIDVASWWRPTGANYFDRVPKSLALDALEQVGGPALAGAYAKAKKTELAQACERIFAGNFIGDAETMQAALAWVPDAMRFASGCGAPADDDGQSRPSEPFVEDGAGADTELHPDERVVEQAA